MLKKYYEPLIAHSSSKKPHILSKQVKEIFSITETLYNYHSMLLEGLERRITAWTPETLIGEYFFGMADFLRCYPQYVNGYDFAVEILTKCEENNHFNELLKKLTNDPKHKGMNLYSYLIMPVQRIPRYILLINDYMKRTDSTHPDQPGLKKALQKVSEIADWIDEQKTIYDKGQELIKLNSNILKMPTGLTLVVPGRALVKDTSFKHLDSEVYCFLFNDLLVITKKLEVKKKKKAKEEPQQYQFINKVELKTAAVHSVSNNKKAISLMSGGNSILLEAANEGEKNEWVEELKKSCSR